MNQTINDFIQLGPLRIISKFLMGLRGLFIVSTLLPAELGNYTIWLLYVFYFSMVDFNLFNTLERDVPHYNGIKDAEGVNRVTNTGWSLFYILNVVAVISLGITAFVFLKDGVLAVLLCVYLLTDKVYRSYESNARIHFRYKESGLSELIVAVTSLVMIVILLPRWGTYSIFIGFSIALILGSLYLYINCPLQFRWYFKLKESFVYIRSAIFLWLFIYSIEIFHAISLTVFAVKWDKATLGYFAFSFRIFQIGLMAFPYLMQEITRTRMYYNVAQSEREKFPSKDLFLPMEIYCLVTAIVWLFVYWWADWGIARFLPAYINSVNILKILTLALLPLGITKICSDYLCGQTQKKTGWVILIWGIGILFQVSGLLFLSRSGTSALTVAPIVYVAATIFIYAPLVSMAFNFNNNIGQALAKMIYLFSPLMLVGAIIFLMDNICHFSPGVEFQSNLAPFFVSLLSLIVLAFMVFMAGNRKKSLSFTGSN